MIVKSGTKIYNLKIDFSFPYTKNVKGFHSAFLNWQKLSLFPSLNYFRASPWASADQTKNTLTLATIRFKTKAATFGYLASFFLFLHFFVVELEEDLRVIVRSHDQECAKFCCLSLITYWWILIRKPQKLLNWTGYTSTLTCYLFSISSVPPWPRKTWKRHSTRPYWAVSIIDKSTSPDRFIWPIASHQRRACANRCVG